MSFILNYFTESGDKVLSNFNYGFIAGVVVFFVLAIFTRLIFFVFFSNPNRCPGITIRAEKGKIFFSAGAIADIVRIASSSFTNVRLDKIYLIKEKDILSIDITTTIINREDPLTGTMEMLQAKILDTMSERLGISSVKSVNISVKKIPSATD